MRGQTDTSNFLVSLQCQTRPPVYCTPSSLDEWWKRETLTVMEQPRRSPINPFYRLSADNPFLPTVCDSKSANNKNENRLKVPKVQKFDVDTVQWSSKKKLCPDSSEILLQVPKSQGSCIGSKIRPDTKISKEMRGGELSRSFVSPSSQIRDETAMAAKKKPPETVHFLDQESPVVEKKPPKSPSEASDRCFTFISIRDKASPSRTAKTRTLPSSYSTGGKASNRQDQESLPAAPQRPRSNTFVISETKSPLAAKVKENIKLIREESKLSKSLMASSILRLPGQRKIKSEVDGKPQRNLMTNSLNSKEGPGRFESFLWKCSPKQKSAQSERVIIDTESNNTKWSERKTTELGTPCMRSNRVQSPISSRTQPPTSTLNQNLSTASKPPPMVSNTRRPRSTLYSSSNYLAPMTTSRSRGASPNRGISSSSISSPVATKAERNDRTMAEKAEGNEQMTSRPRTQSLSEMKVKEHPSSSAGKTNATRSRLYIQRKTPAATSNNRSSCQVKQEDRQGRSLGKQELLGGCRSKSVSSVLSAREEGREKARMGTQTQGGQAEPGRSASSRTSKQSKESSLLKKSSGSRGSMSKSIPNLYNPPQRLMETEKKTMTKSQVYTSSSKGKTSNSDPAGCSSTTFKKNSKQGSQSQISRVGRPRERMKSENVKSLPPETDLAFRRPSIHQSLININQECEEVIRQIFVFNISLFSRWSSLWWAWCKRKQFHNSRR